MYRNNSIRKSMKSNRTHDFEEYNKYKDLKTAFEISIKNKTAEEVKFKFKSAIHYQQNMVKEMDSKI
jgi:hypothetical protein